MRVDPHLVDQMKEEVERKLEMVKREFAWINEFKELQLKKLRKRYLEDLVTERIVVKAFKVFFLFFCFLISKSPHQVSTFPLRKLSPLLEQQIQAVHNFVKKEQELLLLNNQQVSYFPSYT